MLNLPPQLQTAFRLLNEGGFEAYLVGGAVRDFVRDGSPAHDWDITTTPFRSRWRPSSGISASSRPV